MTTAIPTLMSIQNLFETIENYLKSTCFQFHKMVKIVLLALSIVYNFERKVQFDLTFEPTTKSSNNS